MDGGSSGAPLPGWYRDPWNAGQQRYWDGRAWTGHVYAGGATITDDRVWAPSSFNPLAQRPTEETHVDDVPVEPEVEPPYVGEAAPATEAAPAGGQPPHDTKTQFQRWAPILLVLALIVGVSGGIGLVYAASGGFHKDKKVSSTSPTTTPRSGLLPPALTPGGTPNISVAPSTSSDPSAARLSDLVVRQSDTASDVIVQPISGGNEVSGAPTLDVCNGNYPSEAKRSARLQDVATTDQGDLLLSTEAVLYDKPASTDQAFNDLKSVVGSCPSTPVESPVGEPTVTTKVNGSPDSGWPQVAGVDRLAYDLTTTDDQGQAQHTFAVYLRRGRALIGVYFANPDGAQPSVNGQTTIPGIVNVFATRLAQLPANVVNG